MRWKPIIAVLLGAAAVVAVAALGLRGAAPDRPEATPLAARPVPLQGAGDASAPAWSPKGQYLAFAVGSEVRLGRMGRTGVDEVVAVGIDGAEPGWVAGEPAWHPRPLLAFEAGPPGEPRLWYVPPGPAPMARRMLSAGKVPGESGDPSMGAGGEVLAYTADGDLWIWDRRAGAPIRVETPKGASEPRVAPGGGRVAVTSGSAVLVLEVATGAEVARHEGAVLGEWLDDSRLVAFSGEQVVVLDPERRALATGARVGVDGGPGVSEDGRWVAWVPSEGDRIVLSEVDGTRRFDLDPGLAELSEPVIAQGFGQAFVAFLGRREDGGRGLWVAEITQLLGAPEIGG